MGRPGYCTKGTLNKLLSARPLTPSFLRRQEPKTLWTEVPAFAGTTGRDKHPGHGLIQRFPGNFMPRIGLSEPFDPGPLPSFRRNPASGKSSAPSSTRLTGISGFRPAPARRFPATLAAQTQLPRVWGPTLAKTLALAALPRGVRGRPGLAHKQGVGHAGSMGQGLRVQDMTARGQDAAGYLQVD